MTYIDEVEERAKKATPGPWSHSLRGIQTQIVSHADIPRCASLVLVDDSYLLNEDSEFIAAARTDVPILVARLRHAITSLRGYGLSGLLDLADELERSLGENGK